MKQINLYYGCITSDEVTINANLHPDKQIEILHEIIENNDSPINIYCNSPYIINEITLIKGYSDNNVPHPKSFEITNRHFEIKENGEIIEGKYYKSMISDDNLLNNKLAEGNDKYSDMLDLKQEKDNG